MRVDIYGILWCTEEDVVWYDGSDDGNDNIGRFGSDGSYVANALFYYKVGSQEWHEGIQEERLIVKKKKMA